MRKKLFIIIVIFLTLIAIPATIFLAVQRQELRQRAAPTTTLSLSPGSLTKKVGETFSVEVIIDTAENQIVSADIYLTFDPTKLEAQTITNGALFPNILTSGVVESGTASITVGAPSSVSPVKGRGTAAVVRFKALEATTAPASIRFAANTFVGALGEGGTNVLIGTTPATVTITNGVSPTPLITPSATPSPSATFSGQLLINDTFDKPQLDTSIWRVQKASQQSEVIQSGGKLKTTTRRTVAPPRGRNINWSGIEASRDVTGDFQAQVMIDNFQAPADASASSGIEFYSPPDIRGIFLKWVKKQNKQYVEFSSIISSASGALNVAPQFDLTNITSLTLKFIRRGLTAQAFVDTGDGFKEVGTLSEVFDGEGRFWLGTVISDTTTQEVSASFDNFAVSDGFASDTSKSPVLEVLIPSKDTRVIDGRVTIEGKAPPGSTVTITIYSEPRTAVVTADANGDWFYTSTTPLTDGPHNIVASTKDPTTGATQTSSSSFVVASGGTAASQSAIPISGNFTITLLLLSAGILSVIVGMIMGVL